MHVNVLGVTYCLHVYCKLNSAAFHCATHKTRFQSSAGLLNGAVSIRRQNTPFINSELPRIKLDGIQLEETALKPDIVLLVCCKYGLHKYWSLSLYIVCNRKIKKKKKG